MSRIDGGREAALSRRTLLAALGLGIASCRSSSRERAVDETRAIPLVYDEHGGLMIAARIDGHPPVRLILDTGASRSTISTAYAEELGLVLRAGDPIEGSAGVVESSSAAADLEIGGLGALRLDFAVYGFGSYDTACVGILGHEFLSRTPFRIRYGARELQWNARAPARSLPMQLDHGIPRIVAEIGGRPVHLRVDTGAAFPPGDSAYLNLTVGQARELGLTGKPINVFTATGTGGAVLELPVHRLESLVIAGVPLAKAFAIVQPRVGYFAREDAVGFVGNAVLDKLDPYFDYARGVFGVAG